MTNPCPDKIEPATLNHEAREKLVDEISKRVQLAQIVTRRNISFAVEYSNKAMVQAEGFSLKDAESNLSQAQEWLGYTASNLQHDIKRIDDLKQLAMEIIKSEEL